jgi:hypothetical protein
MKEIKDCVSGLATLKPANNSWIFISYAFRDQEVFQRTTAIAQQNLDSKLDAKKVPLPKKIISKYACSMVVLIKQMAYLRYYVRWNQ